MFRLSLLALALVAWPAFGQDEPPVIPPVVPPVVVPDAPAKLEITGPTEFKLGDWIELELKGGPQGAIRWRFKDATGSAPKHRFPYKTAEGNEDPRRIELSYQPGKWTLEALASDAKTIEDDSHTFTIEGGVPVDPDVPVPVVKTLKQLAGDKADAVGKTYADLLEALGKKLSDGKPMIATLEEFRALETEWLFFNKATGHGATAAIAARLNVKTLADLAAPLAKVVEELAAPFVPSGKKLIVLVHESADDDGAIGRLIVNIRDGEIAKYLEDNGHTALILDDDLESPVLAKLRPFEGLPTLYVLDQATQAVTYKVSAPMASADFLAALKKGGA